MRRVMACVAVMLMLCVLGGCWGSGSPGADDLEQARDAFSKGFYLEAEKGYERYLQIEPQGTYRKEAWERLSEICISIKGDLDKAVVLLEAMYLELGTDPDEAWEIMNKLGQVYTQMGNPSKALESYEKAITHTAGNPDRMFRAQMRMAELYRATGNYDLVIATLVNCAEIAPDNDAKARCLYKLAQSYSFISSWGQCKRSIDKLLELEGVSSETKALAIFLLADYYENERDYAKTRELLESISTTYPNPKVVEARLANLPVLPDKPEEPVPPANMPDPPAQDPEPAGEGI
ncbi:tetratricopeptide repeat protein [Pseudodesulfovibrio sp.]|uniref:tetratricopeptide repeat protein n=1 Tax=unclassified Pseudodesulfovibrio TaxID=2661612 RepID=UPI003AFFA5E9